MRPFISGVIAGYGIAVPVGAIAVLILETGLRRGFAIAASAAAGAASADLIYSAVAVLGGAAIADLVGSVEGPLQVASAVVLAVIGIVGLWRATRGEKVTLEDAAPARPGSTYARFLALTLINPATVAYFAAIVIGLGLAVGMTPGQGVAFVAGAGLASFSWQVVLAATGAFAGARLGERARTVLSVTGHLLVLGLAVLIVAR
jgi:arginine exporter protein ArgO